MNRTLRSLTLLCLLAIAVSACAHQPEPSAYDPPGFFTAIWHGMVSPFALIGSIFMDIRVYAFPNSGAGYDWGYFLGMAFWGGGLAKL